MFAHLNGVDLFFEVDGYGLVPRDGRLVEKPMLAVLHGGPGWDHTALVPQLHPLAEHAQLLYVDHRGHGRSSRPPAEQCTPEAMADDLAALRQHLGIRPERFVVLGISFGGIVALAFAARHPRSLAHLVLSSTPPNAAAYDASLKRAATLGTPTQVEALHHLVLGTLRDEQHLPEAWDLARPLYYHRT